MLPMGGWIDAAHDAAKSFLKGQDDFNADGTFEGYEWHHHIIAGVMQLVEESSHRGKKHIGSPVFWEIIHARRYDGK